MPRTWLNQVWKDAVLRRLSGLTAGGVMLLSGGQSYACGDPASPLQATLTVHDDRFFRRIALGGGLGAAESLLDAEWSCDDLTALIRIFIRNAGVSTGLDQGWAALLQWKERANQWWQRNSVAGARQNIHQHYDLGNSFFKLFLDDTLSYSCGLFQDPRASLREASLAKIRQACRKLELSPTDHLLEIGTGWGALAIHAAKQANCRVTSTTISAEQYSFARQRVRDAGLSQQVSIEQLDYRELQGKYDKLVSIEMIEAVGRQFLDTYFRQCSAVLRSDGLMLLQAIVIRDQLFERHSQSVDFIGKYIFPGGFLPSVAAISDCVARCTDFRICHLEDMTPHYVSTLEAWRARFWQNIGEIRGLGFDERFIRMWDYYFQYCAAAFAERQVNVVQIVLAKPDYLGVSVPGPTLKFSGTHRELQRESAVQAY